MSSATSPQLELLRAKLALAIGPLDVNLAYHEVKASRPDALSEPWSTDMSGPHKLVVFNNKTFTLVEVPAEQLAFCMARGCPPIDAGENIRLYLNDVWQLDIFNIIGLTVADYRDPRTGRDLVGSLYYSLIKSVDKCILKKEDCEKEDETLAAGNNTFMGDDWFMGDVWFMGDDWEEVNVEEGPSWDYPPFHEHARDSDDRTQGGEDSDEDSVECMSGGNDNHAHADAVMER